MNTTYVQNKKKPAWTKYLIRCADRVMIASPLRRNANYFALVGDSLHAKRLLNIYPLAEL